MERAHHAERHRQISGARRLSKVGDCAAGQPSMALTTSARHETALGCWMHEPVACHGQHGERACLLSGRQLKGRSARRHGGAYARSFGLNRGSSPLGQSLRPREAAPRRDAQKFERDDVHPSLPDGRWRDGRAHARARLGRLTARPSRDLAAILDDADRRHARFEAADLRHLGARAQAPLQRFLCRASRRRASVCARSRLSPGLARPRRRAWILRGRGLLRSLR